MEQNRAKELFDKDSAGAGLRGPWRPYQVDPSAPFRFPALDRDARRSALLLLGASGARCFVSDARCPHNPIYGQPRRLAA
jgi:hypothetical protein